MITPQLISRMSAPPIEQRKTPTTANTHSSLIRRRDESNTADLSSLPAVRAGGRSFISRWLATPAHKFQEIAEWLEAKALPTVAIVIFVVIALNAPSWAAKAAVSVTL